MLGWIPLPPPLLVQPARSRRRPAQPSPQAISQSPEPAQSAELAQLAQLAQPAEPAQLAPPPRYMQQRPRPLPARNDPPMYRRAPMTEPPPVRTSQAMSVPPVLAYADSSAAAEMMSPYMHPTRWLVYLRAFVAIAIALLAVSYILYEALAVPG
jgi:hypothetical protein